MRKGGASNRTRHAGDLRNCDRRIHDGSCPHLISGRVYLDFVSTTTVAPLISSISEKVQNHESSVGDLVCWRLREPRGESSWWWSSSAGSDDLNNSRSGRTHEAQRSLHVGRRLSTRIPPCWYLRPSTLLAVLALFQTPCPPMHNEMSDIETVVPKTGCIEESMFPEDACKGWVGCCVHCTRRIFYMRVPHMALHIFPDSWPDPDMRSGVVSAYHKKRDRLRCFGSDLWTTRMDGPCRWWPVKGSSSSGPHWNRHPQNQSSRAGDV
ncbi:hypothetical protein IWX90DRAFT_316294 [Phyllosticta citrichinensis]|uniref:Uncharacterized protein n=1 Tax=Phyllosticta citrichinensis TaxID=1130410 RepID=A0ABR1XJ58_9PEZI